ncbi:hypothetical protein BH11GEM1_BH11GEM1_29910 [soil metagenome]
MLTLTFAAILVVALLAHRAGATTGSEGIVRGMLESRGVVAVVFAATFAIVWLAWAAWNPVAVVHDEMAYVLQAEIFARGRWSMPSPPIPAFWEQPHVLVVPTLAGKYFPGHSLVLVVGTLLGWPPLMPLVLQATSAAILFVLARRLANGGAALLTWVIWLTTPMVLYLGPSYFSEGTTTACWLAGWYALLRWREVRATRWLLIVAFFTGWSAITRPLTGVAYAIPVGIVVLHDVVRYQRWKDLAIAFALGTAVVSLLFVWSARTTGDWRLTPWSLYTRQYMPYDVLGFGMNATPPTRALTPQLAQVNDLYGPFHVTHLPSTLLSSLRDRVRYLLVHLSGASGGVLLVFALLGLVTMRRVVAFAAGTCVLLVVTYLAYATPPQWALYYYETAPVYAFLAAAGIAWAAALIGRPSGTAPSPGYTWTSPRWSAALAGGAVALMLPGAVTLLKLRTQHVRDRRFISHCDAQLASIRDPRAVVFVRYATTHNANAAFVRNVVDPATAPVWSVYDRGPDENARLLALAPGRTAYLFDETRDRILRYDPSAPASP